MRGYRGEEWTREQMKKCFALPTRLDFWFKIARRPPKVLETFVATSLPVWLAEASAPAPDHKDRLSVLAGAFKRLGAEVYKCTYKKHKKIIKYCRKYIHPQFKTFNFADVSDTLTWIDGVNHPEARKAELREAYIKVCAQGLWPQPGTDDEDARVCKSFIKDEKYDDLKPARWINSSSDLLKVVFGPIADKCMEMLCQHPAMIKTIPVSERAKAIWSRLGGEDVIGVSADATAMEDHYANIPDPESLNNPKDTSINDPRYRISNELMLHMCGHILPTEAMLQAVRFAFYSTPGLDKQPGVPDLWSRIESSSTLSALCTNILDTYRKLDMRDFGHVTVNAILCSGEMNTSFKNTSTMFSMVNFAAFDLSRGKLTSVRSFNEGDDSLSVYPIGYAPDEKWWASYGWVVKVEFVGRVNEASFCGLIFAPEDLVSVPDIRKTLAKSGWTNRRYVRSGPKCRMSLLRSKALSMACEYNDVPILGAFAQRLLFLTRHVHVRKSIVDSMEQYERSKLQQYIKQKPWQEAPNVGIQTRRLVERLQNITVGQQLAIEQKLSLIILNDSFSLPELDFPTTWIHNVSRCYTDTQIPKTYNFSGREELVSFLKAAVLRFDQRPKKIARMLQELDLLARGAI